VFPRCKPLFRKLFEKNGGDDETELATSAVMRQAGADD